MSTKQEQATIGTTFHAYRFNLKDPNEKILYEELAAKLEAQGLRCFETWGGKGKHYMPELDGKHIELEPEFLFENQWNTAPIEGVSANGLRVFDWAQDYMERERAQVAQGHYLDQTAEMQEARRARFACGYCGKQYQARAWLPEFCTACLDSEYLKVSDLPLLRLRCVTNKAKREDLTPEERDRLLPAYKSAQLHGSTVRGRKRIAEKRARIEREYREKTAAAKTEHDGLLWLMDHGLSVHNVIFYSHTGRFCFGWRKPVEPEVQSEILDIISEFPFSYEIKCADGRTLSAGGDE